MHIYGIHIHNYACTYNYVCLFVSYSIEAANTEAGISPFYDHLEIVQDDYCSLAVGNTELRTNSPPTSNHSSYIEMHHDDNSVNDLVDINAGLQPNPSYSTVTSQTHEH